MEPVRRTPSNPLPSHTYVEYYNLVEPPFGLAPNPRFIYQSRSHSVALVQLTDALDRREGLIVITGEVGVGKTTICRTLLQHLPQRTPLSLILDPFLDANDFLRQVLRDFGAVSSEQADRERIRHATRDGLLTALRAFLAAFVSLDEYAVIMIDEAQDLGVEVLEQIRRLANRETRTAKLQIILVGQPELESSLRRPALTRLNQEVSYRCQLQPLRAAEVGSYIERRLWVARGGPAGLMPDRTGAESGEPGSSPSEEAAFWRVGFTPAAVRMIAKLSGGIPRVINALCDRSLEIGFEGRQRMIGWKTVLASAGRLPLPLPFIRPFARKRPGRVAASRGMLIAALVTSWASSLTKGVRRADDSHADHAHPIDPISLTVRDQPRAQGDIVTKTDIEIPDVEFRTRPLGDDAHADHARTIDPLSLNLREQPRTQGDIVTKTDIPTREVELRTRLLGFDKAEVRALLAELFDEREQALTQIEALRRQLNRIQGDLTVGSAPQRADTAQQLERILSSAHRVADEIRREAERDAARALADAESRAARVLDEAATSAKQKSDAATSRLREVEREIERMRACHRQVRSGLETAVTVIGSTLADVSTLSTFDAPEHADEAVTDPLRAFVEENEAKAQV